MQPLARDIKLLRGDIYKYTDKYTVDNLYIYIVINHHYIETYKCNQMYTFHYVHRPGAIMNYTAKFAY
jgi:hypothetical protein